MNPIPNPEPQRWPRAPTLTPSQVEAEASRLREAAAAAAGDIERYREEGAAAAAELERATEGRLAEP